LLLREDCGKLLQTSAIVAVCVVVLAVAGKGRNVVDWYVRQAQEIADHPAARVRYKVELRAGRQRGRDHDRVLDRAAAQSFVLERVDIVLEVPRQIRPLLGGRRPNELAEAAPGAGSGAVQEQKDRLARVEAVESGGAGFRFVLATHAGGLRPGV